MGSELPRQAATTLRTKGRDALRSFWAGLTDNSLSCALATVAFALAEFVAAMIFITPSTLVRIEPEYLKENRIDDRAEATLTALRMKLSPVERPGVVYLGQSNARLSLFSNGLEMQEEIVAAAGMPVDYYHLSTDAQSPVDWFVILDQLPADFRGVVVLSVYDRHPLKPELPEHMRELLGKAILQQDTYGMALETPTLKHPPEDLRHLIEETEGKVAPVPDSGIYFLDHLQFFASRRSTLTRLGVAPPRGPGPQFVRPGGGFRSARRLVLDLRTDPSPPFLRLLPALELVVKMLRARNIEVVLLEAPINPWFDSMKFPEGSRTEVYEPAMFAFARRTGARYWNPSPDANLAPEDFLDGIHMGNWAAQRRFERELVERLGRLLQHVPVFDGPKTPPARRRGPLRRWRNADVGIAADDHNEDAEEAGINEIE